MSTLIDVPIGHVRKHPLNPRTRAVADDDMVASVAGAGILEPLIIAPVEGEPDRYVLIAGHRRVDACKKAEVKTAPAVVRADLNTDALQLEAMLIENGHRSDLTPIEEAHAYEQLELFGYTAQAIASAVGRDVKTIRARKKLLKLTAGTQKKVAAGDVTLEDAAEMGKYAGDPEAEKRLTRAAGEGRLRGQLASEASLVKARQRVAEEVAALVDQGAVLVELPAGQSMYDAVQMHSWAAGERDLALLTTTFSPEPADHDGCLGYIEWSHQSYGGAVAQPQVSAVCTDPRGHRDQLDEKAKAAALEAERQAAEDRATAAREDAAADARTSAAIDAIGDAPSLPAVLADAARLLLPALLTGMYDADEVGRYQQLIAVPDDQRWQRYWQGADRALYRDHVEDLAIASDAKITRALFAALVARADRIFGDEHPDNEPTRRSYADLLAALGHPMTGDVDAKLLANLNGDTEQESA